MTSPQPQPEPARGPYPTRRPEPARPVPPPRPSRVPTRNGESQADFIRRLVDAAPPLTEAQRARLRPVLAPMREPGRLAS